MKAKFELKEYNTNIQTSQALEDIKFIKDFIIKRDYTYDVYIILDYYINYYLKGYYISHTMKDCIYNCDKQLRRLSEVKIW